MRVLYFHQHFTTPKYNGGTRSYEFAKKLIQKGHSVTMVCGKNEKYNFHKETSKNIIRVNVDGIDVIQINVSYSNKYNILKRAIKFLEFAFHGIKIASQEKYDILFATLTPLTAGIPGIWMKLFKRKKTKFIFEVRDLWPELPKALGLKNPFLLKGMSILEKVSYNKSDALIGLSPGICDGINKRLKKKIPITMIPNGCDLDIFKPNYRVNLKLKGILKSDFVAVYSGAHGEANGLDVILDTAKELIKRNRLDIKIIFIGDGKFKETLLERSKREFLNNCVFYDPVPKIKLNDIFCRSNVGLMVLKNLPEFYYGTSPNKFFDYISAGMPVINNYPGWLSEIIKENNCGEVVNPNNAVAFADALEKLADDKDLCKYYGTNSRKLAEQKFSRNDLVDKFISFLEKIHNNSF